MGWKLINGRPYYYRSVRDGSCVRTEYVGGGEVAGLAAQLDAMRRGEEAAQQQAERAERERVESEERALTEWFDRVEAMADVAMAAAGYHQHHRGEWRRARR